MKSGRLIKRLIAGALALTLILSINSMAAIVSDNDGSAFITKAEFDSLKNSFQAQIDSYNNSIDSKIDGAIAAYLAGIKVSTTTTNSFYNGSGEYALIVNTNAVNDLQPGKILLDWTTDYAGLANNAGSSSTNIIMKMTRTSSSNYFEGFMVDKNKQLICWSKYILPSCQSSMTACSVAGFGSYTKTDNAITARWHAYWDGKCTLNSVGGASGYKSYVADLKYQGFYKWYCTLLNVGWRDDTIRQKCVYSCSYDIKDTENDYATIIMDGSKLASTSTKTNCFILYDQNLSLYETDSNYATESWSSSDLPPADISVSVSGGYNGKISDIATYGAGAITTFDGWVNTGTSIYVSTLDTAGTWYEPVIKTVGYAPNEIKNTNVSSALLSKYSSYGWTGAITQGIPIDTFSTSGTILFHLDTTDLGQKSVIAFSGKAFDCTKDIKSQEVSSEIDEITINETKLPSGQNYYELDPQNNSIKIQISASNDDGCPIFFKIGWLPSETSSIRKRIKLPTQYTFTSAS